MQEKQPLHEVTLTKLWCMFLWQAVTCT